MDGTVAERPLLLVGDDQWAAYAGVPPEGFDDAAVRATTVAGAVDRLSAAVDCVVSAPDLPDGDAFDLLDAVGERLAVPFVLAPADGDEAAASRALAAGMDAYVPLGSDAGETLPAAVERVTAAGGPGTRGGDAPAGEGGAPAAEARTTGEAGGATVDDGWTDEALRADLDRSRRRLEAVIEASPVGIVALDADGCVELWNRGMAEIFGHGEAEVLGERPPIIPEDEQAAFEERLAASGAGERFRDVELTRERKDGTPLEVAISSAPVRDGAGDVDGQVSVVEDRTQQREHERRLDRYRTVVETVRDVIWTVDADGRFTFVNVDAEQVYGIPREEILGQPIFDVIEGIEWNDRGTGGPLADDLAALIDGELDSVDRQGTFPIDDEQVTLDVHVVPLTVDGEVVGAAGINRDITEQRRREDRLAARQRELTALHATARELLEAETSHEIAEVVVAAADEVLDLPGVTVYLYDQGDNELAPAAHSGDKDRLYGTLPTVAPGEGITGHAFLQDDTTVHEDVHRSERLLNEAAGMRSGLFIPLGEHGILIAGAPAVDAFDEAIVERAELLAANAEAALQRAEREQTLRTRDRTVQEQNRRLERLAGINRRIRRVDRALVHADTRAEIEREVPELLVESDRFAWAWIGARDGDSVARRSAAGDGEHYLDRVDVPASDVPADGEPVARALDAGEPVAVPDVAEDPRGRGWRREALRADVRSVAAFPLRYDGIDYGALGIYATSPEAFDELSAAVLGELADTIAYAIHAVEQRAALMSDHRLECEFALEGVSGGLADVAAALGTPVTATSVTPRSDDDLLVTATVPQPDAAELPAVVAALPSVEAGTVVTEGSPSRVQFRLDGLVAWERLSTTAGRPRAVQFDGDGTARASVTLSADTAVTGYVDRLADQFAGVDLVARRQRAVRPLGALDDDAGMTDRQQEVLSAAYHAGFFAWPRERTGEEVAGDLDISQPAFLRHVRTSERKLVAAFLEPPGE